MELAPKPHNHEPWTIAVAWARPWHRPVLRRPAVARLPRVGPARRPTHGDGMEIVRSGAATQADRSIASGRDLLRSQFPIGWSCRYF